MRFEFLQMKVARILCTLSMQTALLNKYLIRVRVQGGYRHPVRRDRLAFNQLTACGNILRFQKAFVKVRLVNTITQTHISDNALSML